MARSEAPALIDAGPFAVQRGESAGDSLRRLLCRSIDRALAAIASGVAGVHDARKRVKECRACVRLARSAIPRGQRHRLEESLRSAARGLGASRDAEVMVASFAKLTQGDGPGRDGRIAAARAALTRSRTRARAKFAAAAPDARTALENARELVAALPRRIAWKHVWRGLERSHVRMRAGWNDARRAPTGDRLHRWRRRVKDLWYQMRLFEPAWPGPLAAWARELHALADGLGDDHDLHVLWTELCDSGDEALRAEMRKRIAARRAKLQRHAFALAERLARERPAAAMTRMRAYVRIWRRLG